MKENFSTEKPRRSNLSGGNTTYTIGLPGNICRVLHRLDGPAVIYADGFKCYYIEGKRIPCNSDQEFIRYVKLKAFW